MHIQLLDKALDTVKRSIYTALVLVMTVNCLTTVWQDKNAVNLIQLNLTKAYLLTTVKSPLMTQNLLDLVSYKNKTTSTSSGKTTKFITHPFRTKERSMPYSFRHVYHSLLLNADAMISSEIKYYAIQTYHKAQLQQQQQHYYYHKLTTTTTTTTTTTDKHVTNR